MRSNENQHHKINAEAEAEYIEPLLLNHVAAGPYHVRRPLMRSCFECASRAFIWNAGASYDDACASDACVFSSTAQKGSAKACGRATLKHGSRSCKMQATWDDRWEYDATLNKGRATQAMVQ
jgi:hypothetical protein